jgi:monofunctional biosynthetic peptidoglycan transglycosylase
MISFFVIKNILKWLLRIFLAAVVITIIWVGAYNFINPGKTNLMKSRETDLGKEIERTWVDYDEISPNMPLALICGEDQRFTSHWGFDLKAIQKAIEKNARGGKVYGASTITQQTAKNVFLWEGRSWIRKGFEVWFTCWIEVLWSKKRTLEIYMNIIETGDGVFGVEAAAKHYFKKSAKNLTRNQCAQIASIVPCPTTCGFNSRFAYNHRLFIQRWMRKYGQSVCP